MCVYVLASRNVSLLYAITIRLLVSNQSLLTNTFFRNTLHPVEVVPIPSLFGNFISFGPAFLSRDTIYLRPPLNDLLYGDRLRKYSTQHTHKLQSAFAHYSASGRYSSWYPWKQPPIRTFSRNNFLSFLILLDSPVSLKL